MRARAFLAGVLGAALISGISAIARGAGVAMDLEQQLGSFFTGPDDAYDVGTFVLGLAVNFAIGGVLGIVYAAILARTARASVFAGAMLGLAHAIVAGALLALMPPLHPSIPEAISAPGFAMIARGQAEMLLFVLVHVGFGALMSLVSVRHRLVIGRRLHA